MMSGRLILPLRREYFEQIKSGEKTEEFRLIKPHWIKRLELDGFPRSYDTIELTLGYPAAEDMVLRLILPWKGFVRKVITHPHFGESPVAVFAIDVRH